MITGNLELAADSALADFERRTAAGEQRMNALEAAVPRVAGPGLLLRAWRALVPPPTATRELYADIPFAPRPSLDR